jgi:hypothetical protein
MSDPTVVSEKAVWLETNLTNFLLRTRRDECEDVVNIILARMNPPGIEELYDYLIVHELDGMSEDEINASVPDSVFERAERLVRVPDAGDILKETITRNNEIFKAGMKAQKEFDKP